MKNPRLLGLLVPPVLAVGLIAVLAPFVSWRSSGDPSDEAVPDFELPEVVTFNDHVRPILVNNCFACHGSDPGTREAELRLDDPEVAFAPRADGLPVIVKGDPAASAVVRRIHSADPDEVMPPPDSRK